MYQVKKLKNMASYKFIFLIKKEMGNNMKKNNRVCHRAWVNFKKCPLRIHLHGYQSQTSCIETSSMSMTTSSGLPSCATDAMDAPGASGASAVLGVSSVSLFSFNAV